MSPTEIPTYKNITRTALCRDESCTWSHRGRFTKPEAEKHASEHKHVVVYTVTTNLLFDPDTLLERQDITPKEQPLAAPPTPSIVGND